MTSPVVRTASLDAKRFDFPVASQVVVVPHHRRGLSPAAIAHTLHVTLLLDQHRPARLRRIEGVLPIVRTGKLVESDTGHTTTVLSFLLLASYPPTGGGHRPDGRLGWQGSLCCREMASKSEPAEESARRPHSLLTSVMLVIEYGIVVSLLVIAAVVLVRTIFDFFWHWHAYPDSVVGAIDGTLVVIILLDLAHTVFGHLRSLTFAIRPFLVIGILAGVRDILSASAHLTLARALSGVSFDDTLTELGAGVGVVILLLLGLLVLHHSHHLDRQERPS